MVTILIVILFVSVAFILLLLLAPVAFGCKYDKKMIGFVKWLFLTVIIDRYGATLKLGSVTLFAMSKNGKTPKKKKRDSLERKLEQDDGKNKAPGAKDTTKELNFNRLWENRNLVAVLISKIFHMMKRIIRGIRIDKLKMEVRQLPVEPAVMGYSYALYYGFIFPYIPPYYDIIFEPSGEKSRANYLELAVRLYLYRLLLALLYFLIAIPKRDTYKFIRSFSH